MATQTEQTHEVERFGSLIVRFSFLSMKWVVFDGTVMMGEHRHKQDAVKQAKKLAGVDEQEEDLIVPIPPVDTDISGFRMSPEVAANLPGLSSSSSPVLNGPSEIPPPELSSPEPPPPPLPPPSVAGPAAPGPAVAPPTSVGNPLG